MKPAKRGERVSKPKPVKKSNRKKAVPRKKAKPSLAVSTAENPLHERIQKTLASIDKAMLDIRKKVSACRKVKNPNWAHLGDLCRIHSLLKEV